MPVPKIFSRVDVCENEVYCKNEMGQCTSDRQAVLESDTVYPKIKQCPTQCRLDDCALLEER
jgi:hypothetical protein